VFWDVDGTLADTEMDGHRPAFNQTFADLGLPFHWDRELYSQLLAIPGGLRRVASHAKDRGVSLQADQLETVRERKRFHYMERIRQGHVSWRPGVQRLLNELHQAGLQQWIVTSSGLASVRALLDQGGAELPRFDGLVTADDVTKGKPDPEGYRLALQRSGLEADAVIAIEDSAAGQAAACMAGLRCLLTPSPWDVDLKDSMHRSVAVLNHLGDPECHLHHLQGPPCTEGQVTLKYLQALLDLRS
jgi:HAD superfamily hydrolase (TIGR01509 family)